MKCKCNFWGTGLSYCNCGAKKGWSDYKIEGDSLTRPSFGTSNKFNFLTFKKTKEGYEYAERKGKDSVAFVLYDTQRQLVCLRNEYKPPIEAWVLGAFGGSLDKKLSPLEIVREEVKEESGYTAKKITFVGKYFVSTQMNQFCYLYAVEVDSTKVVKPSTRDVLESLSHNQWEQHDALRDRFYECWKATIILNNIYRLIYND